jgi:hypothetical protein
MTVARRFAPARDVEIMSFKWLRTTGETGHMKLVKAVGKRDIVIDAKRLKHAQSTCGVPGNMHRRLYATKSAIA